MNNNLLIVWRDSNDCGVNIIDEQHRGIVSTINTLFYFKNIGRGEEIMHSVLLILEQYTNFHFFTEEKLMKDAKYPDLEDHVELYEDLLRKQRSITLEHKKIKDTNLVLNFLKEWWMDHISVEDKKMLPYLRSLLKS